MVVRNRWVTQGDRLFDRYYDSYCSLISWNEFVSDIGKYIEMATKKRDEIFKYELVKRL